MAKLFNLEGTYLGEISNNDGTKEHKVEAEGNMYYLPASAACEAKLVKGCNVQFFSIVSDGCKTSDLTVTGFGHSPIEFRDIITWGAGKNSGMCGDDEFSVVCAEKGKEDRRHVFKLQAPSTFN